MICICVFYLLCCAFRRILLFPNGNNVDFLSIYLEAGSTNLPKGWTRDANFRLSLYNQVNSDMTITKGIFLSFHVPFHFIFSPPFKVRRITFSFSVMYFLGILLGSWMELLLAVSYRGVALIVFYIFYNHILSFFIRSNQTDS